MLPLIDKKFAVINRIWNKDLEEINVLDTNNDLLTIPWKEEKVEIQKIRFEYEDQFPENSKETASFWYTEPAKGEVDHKEKRLKNEEISKLTELTPTFKILENINLWDEPDLKSWSNDSVENLKNAITNFLNDWHPEEEKYKISMLSEDIFKEFSLTEMIPSSFFTKLSENLNSIFEPFYINYIDKQGEFSEEIGQRDYFFIIPIVIESSEDDIFINIITNSNGRKIEEVLEEQKSRLAFENELLKKNKSTNHIQNWILFVPEGVFIKIEWKLNGSLVEIINSL
jgi:hypothetical protein